MNDYFLKILSRQRHDEISAAVRAAQLSKPGHSCGLQVNKSFGRLRSFLSKRKRSVAFEPQGEIQRRNS
jgi:hypothetical protein